MSEDISWQPYSSDIILPEQYPAYPGQVTGSNLEMDFRRRRIYTEEKTKVAASCGTVLLKFLAELAILDQDELKNMPICTLPVFLNLSWCKSVYSSNHPSAK